MIISSEYWCSAFYWKWLNNFAKGVEAYAVWALPTRCGDFWKKKMSQYATVVVTTDDNSYGQKGYVSTVVDNLDFADAIYACGAPEDAQIC